MSVSASVRIACRVRPFINSESRDDSVEVLDDNCVSIVNPLDATKRFRFNFTSVHSQDATQDQVFERDVRPLLPSVFTGHTVTIFAYGVTSSGKTHTMQGSPTEPGIIPRVMEALFERKINTRARVTFALSYMEIYKDDVFDLMVASRGTKLPVREDGKGKVFVANLTETPIESTDEFDTHFIAACKGRSVAATNFNRASSRSHAILGIKVSVTENYPGAPTLIGKVNLVDLAGSENNKMTGNDSTRMAESAAINKSLSVLGQVVHALNQRATRIPYRDSKLTRILQDALGGTSISLLICNLAPGAKFKQDTLNTLNFASRTKEIENRPTVNQQAPPPAPAPAPAPASLSSASSRRSLGLGRPRASLVPSSSHSNLPVSVSTSGLPVPTQSRRLSFGSIGTRHVSAGPTPNVVGVSKIQAPSHGRRSSSVGVGYGSHSRRTSMSSANGGNGGDVVIGMTEEEVEAKIANAVEAALAKREQELREKAREEVRLMEEERKRREEVERRQREEEERRQREEEKRREQEEEMRRHQEEERKRQEREQLKQQEEEWQRRKAMEVEDQHSGPPSYTAVAGASSQPENRTMDVEMATPSINRHANLSRRFDNMEYSREPTDAEMAVNMDYATRKKVAKSLIKRARVYQQQNDLPTALQYYLKAQPYAADNLKLQHRIEKIQEAIETGEPFVPSPTAEGSRYNCDSLAFKTVATPSRKRARMGALYEMTNAGEVEEEEGMPDVDEMGMRRRRSSIADF